MVSVMPCKRCIGFYSMRHSVSRDARGGFRRRPPPSPPPPPQAVASAEISPVVNVLLCSHCKGKSADSNIMFFGYGYDLGMLTFYFRPYNLQGQVIYHSLDLRHTTLTKALLYMIVTECNRRDNYINCILYIL